MRITVNHAHVFPLEMNPHGTVERLLKLMDVCGIEEAVCFAPFPHQCDKSGLDPIAWLADKIATHDRLFAFGTVDPRRADIRDQVKRCRDLGMKGLKLHPNSQGFPVLSPRAFSIYEAAEEFGMFCTFHTGVHQARMKDVRVIDFDEVAWNFPKLKFSMEHVGGYHFFHEALAVLFNHVPPPWNPGKSNVFAGLASIFSQSTNRFWYLGTDRLRELVHQVGVDQLIFGLDFPYNQESETMAGMEIIEGLGMHQDELMKVLGGNLRRELGIA